MGTEIPAARSDAVPGGTAGAAPGAAPVVTRRGAFLALMCSVQFMMLVGGTVVTVSLPVIRRELGLGTGELQWVLTAFPLTFGCLLLLGGRCADVFGRRRLFLAGLLVFGAGSLLCAVADRAWVLIGARALAGLGAAMASPAAMALLTSVFVAPRARSTALGAWAAVGAVGATLGNVLGGLLTSAGGWQWIFLVNVPVCVVAAVAVLLLVPAGVPAGRRPRLGLLGGVLCTAAVAALVLGLGELRVPGGLPAAVVLLLGAVALAAAFVVSQVRSPEPLLPLGLFRRRTSVGFALVLVTAGTGIGAYFTTSLFMQETLGWSALRAGLAFVPWAALTAVVAQVASRTLHLVGPRIVVPAAMLVSASGALLLSRAYGPSTAFAPDLLVPFLLLGAGTGAASVSCTVTAMSGVPRSRHGVGGGDAEQHAGRRRGDLHRRRHRADGDGDRAGPRRGRHPARSRRDRAADRRPRAGLPGARRRGGGRGAPARPHAGTRRPGPRPGLRAAGHRSAAVRPPGPAPRVPGGARGLGSGP
ncbi:MFS transporter [Pseudonocardia yuanmonensis]|uniref:MFS transporter n=1 Tax=Pseudonocardia yuanmonensis TaxID=1095914 RepID=A0ABP8X8Q7_9PSEU